MLEFKDNPKESMQTLDLFLSVYYSDLDNKRRCQADDRINLK